MFLQILNKDLTSELQFFFKKEGELKVTKLHFAPFFCPHSFIHCIFLCLIFPATDAQRKPWFYYLIPPPSIFSFPCRIQWHSFLMRLLSLLISVSSGKMNDSRPCNKYNMRRINFSENKNEMLPLLYPFQMFRFIAFSMSASFSKLSPEIHYHLINGQLRKKGRRVRNSTL